MATIKKIRDTKTGKARRMSTDGVNYEYKYYLRFRAHGKQCNRHLWARNEAEVRKYIEAEQGRALNVIDWVDAVDMYNASFPDLSSKHKDDMTATVNALTAVIGNISVGDTTLATIAQFLNKKQILTSGRTANKYRGHFLRIAKWLRSMGLLSDIPFEYVAAVPHNAKQRMPFARDELSTYLDAISDEFARVTVDMILLTGARSSQICRLQMDAIRRDILLLPAQKRGPEREVLLDDVLREILEKAHALKSTVRQKNDNVFVNRTGTAWNRSTLLKNAQRSWKQAGLERRCIHELRHTYGTMAGTSFSPDMIKAAMGHRSRSSSEIYVNTDAQSAAIVGVEVRRKLIDMMRNSRAG